MGGEQHSEPVLLSMGRFLMATFRGFRITMSVYKHLCVESSLGHIALPRREIIYARVRLGLGL